jgi:putative aminopeptidase FrvX
MHKEKLASYQKQLVELLKKDLPGFNDMLRRNNLGNIIVRKP